MNSHVNGWQLGFILQADAQRFVHVHREMIQVIKGTIISAVMCSTHAQSHPSQSRIQKPSFRMLTMAMVGGESKGCEILCPVPHHILCKLCASISSCLLKYRNCKLSSLLKTLTYLLQACFVLNRPFTTNVLFEQTILTSLWIQN